jgi:hypothetical protein
MKQYPSISGKIINEPIYAFDKLDGSNMRAEWTRKNFWSKYGRRHGLLDDSNPMLKKSVPLFEEKYAKALDGIFRRMRLEKATVFFEFYGPKSFAGYHEENDDHTVMLFDIDVFKKGIMPPRDFIKIGEEIEMAKCLYRGNANQDLVQAVRNGTLPGMTFEGVVCKTNDGEMFKIKSNAWLERLKNKCGADEALYEKLA